MFRFLMFALVSSAMWLAALQPAAGGPSRVGPSAHSGSPGSQGPTSRHAMVDGHLHFLNFVQETLGMDALFSALDRAGVTEAVVLGMPQLTRRNERRGLALAPRSHRSPWWSIPPHRVRQRVNTS